MILVLNRKAGKPPKGARYVGRPTIFGNPFKIGQDGDRDQVIEKFRGYFQERLEKDAKFKTQVDKLKDAPALVCWCAPARCHADVLAEYIQQRFK